MSTVNVLCDGLFTTAHTLLGLYSSSFHSSIFTHHWRGWVGLGWVGLGWVALG